MKRKLYFLYTLLALLIGSTLTSCSNEDINIEGVGSLTVRVSTQSLYDGFGTTSAMQNQLLSKDYKIGVTVLVYDETGKLVAEQSQNTKTFQNLSFTFDTMLSKKYNLVAVETMVDGTTGLSEDWDLEGKENLNTLKVINHYDEVKDYRNEFHYWYSVVGVNFKSIDLTNSLNNSFDLVPTGIGAIINCYSFYFTDSPYSYFGIYTKNAPEGRLLSPQYVGTERFIYNQYTSSNTWMLRGFHNFKDEEISHGPDVYLIEEGEIPMTFGALLEDANTFYATPANFTLSVKDGVKYYGGIAYLGGGHTSSSTEGKFFYNAEDLSDWFKMLKKPSGEESNSNFVKPFTVWGASGSEVKNYMSGQGFSAPTVETEDDMTIYEYFNGDQSIAYDYILNTTQNDLSSVILCFSVSKYTESEVNAIISKDYGEGIYLESAGGYCYSDTKTFVMVTKNAALPNYILVTYVPSVASNSPQKALNMHKYVKNSFRKKNIGQKN